MLDKLSKNEYLPQVTFETYLKKKTGRGKRTLFLNKATSENAREYMKQYIQQSKAKAM